jgi:hypothetical protein
MTPMACAWRIVISPMIPQDFPLCYYSSMRNLAVLVIHLIATLARLLGPGGVRSLVAESLLLKHQLLIVNRSRQRSPNLIRPQWLPDSLEDSGSLRHFTATGCVPKARASSLAQRDYR